ncbi:MAG: hypothetical protein OEW15_11735 [Nitrospirota bacterium]|nr:hypothetical protein [Nitrospirota bacterium]
MTCPQPAGPFTIFTGDAKTLPLRIAYASGLPVDITSASEIVVKLPNADGSFTLLKLTESKVAIVSPGTLGQITAPITALVSAALNIGELQDIDVTFTIGGNPFTVRFYGALSVFENT